LVLSPLGGRRLLAQAVTPPVDGHRPQPAAEALAGVVAELGQLADQDREDVLDQVIDILLLADQAASVVTEEGGVKLDKATPGLLIVRMAQALEQAGGRRVHASTARGRGPGPTVQHDRPARACRGSDNSCRADTECPKIHSGSGQCNNFT